MIKADNYSQELARTQKNLRAVSMERDSEREARQKAEAELAKTNETLAIVWTDFEEMMPLKKKAEAEVERLREMVMEAARKGDELLEPYRLRAEKAETLLKQIHAFVEALNPNKK